MSNYLSNLEQKELIFIFKLMSGATLEKITERKDSILLTLAHYNENSKNTYCRAIEIYEDGHWQSNGQNCLTDEEKNQLLNNK